MIHPNRSIRMVQDPIRHRPGQLWRKRKSNEYKEMRPSLLDNIFHHLDDIETSLYSNRQYLSRTLGLLGRQMLRLVHESPFEVL